MSAKRDLGSLWHASGGLLIGLVLAFAGIPAQVGVPLLLLGGLTRELHQHRNSRPRMNAHRWAEAAAWGVGGLAWVIL